MLRNLKGRIVASLDIGSSKIICAISLINGEKVDLVGFSHIESRGISSGSISDMKMAQKSIINAVTQAERMAGVNIENLIVNISASLVKSHRLEESVKVSSSMVKSYDINNLAGKVRNTFRREDRELINLIPLHYKIDDSHPIHNPRYMSGKKLTAKFHAVSTSKTTITNIENCLKSCQLSVQNYIVDSYASAISCLSENENNVGTLLIDIGFDVSSFALIVDGKLLYVDSVLIAGNHITKDIATVLGVDFEAAEKVKNLHAGLILSKRAQKELIALEGEHDSITITKEELNEVISCRIEEIFEQIKGKMLQEKVPEFLVNNVVLTGGTSTIVGCDKLCEEVFNKNCRIGYPSALKDIPEELDSTSYSSIVGMIIFAKNLLMRQKFKNTHNNKGGWVKNLIDWIVS